MLDVLVIGGGPAGLQAALTLARGQQRVSVVDAGPPRNARAVHLHTFVTRDGTAPARFRAIAREELARYGVEVQAARAEGLDGAIGDFTVRTDLGEIRAKRVLLTLGVVDELPALPGLAELWGETVFTCPFCHGHEVRGQRWAVLVPSPELLEMALTSRAWTEDVVMLTDGRFSPDDETRQRLARAGVRLEERRLVGLRPREDQPDRLGALLFSEGEPLLREVLRMRPPQRQTELVRSLGLALDAAGHVVVDKLQQTSRPGIFAAGDLTTPMQSAMGGAASGMMAAAALTHTLALEALGW